MALVIAGERSGVGKTTVTLSLLATLRQRQQQVQSFKVGPDYIDPMFHRYVTGRACRNLDPVLTSPEYVQQCFHQHVQDVEYALVEGVMGLFDGATGSDDWASTAHIARLLNLPVVLVLDCSRISRSIAALVHGYQTFDARIKLAGLILNRIGSDRHLDLLKTALLPLNLPILGVLRRHEDITIPDRHLGLIPTDELPELNRLVDRLAHLGEHWFDWQTLLPLLQTSPSLPGSDLQAGCLHYGNHSSLPIRANHDSPLPHSLYGQFAAIRPYLAIAHDRAFNFYYADNLERLEQLGAKLVFWSPLADEALPEGVSGLYFGGGFPEVFAEQLSQNRLARDSVRSAIKSGMPTYAECGGLMYLAEQLVDFEGRSWKMVGILPTTAEMGKRLTLGYRQGTVMQDSFLLKSGETVWGHEFHRSTLTQLPDAPLYKIRGYDDDRSSTQEGWQEGWQVHNVHASYVHLHWGATPHIPDRFLQACRMYTPTK
jgi:cobyrinic acid a,c-diamide synthase